MSAQTTDLGLTSDEARVILWLTDGPHSGLTGGMCELIASVRTKLGAALDAQRDAGSAVDQDTAEDRAVAGPVEEPDPVAVEA